MKRYFLLLLVASFCLSFFGYALSKESTVPDLIGAWESKSADGTRSVMIVTVKHFSIAHFKVSEFLYTEGGEWTIVNPLEMEVLWEYHTEDNSNVGIRKKFKISQKDSSGLTLLGTEWNRLDDGRPGDLEGAWLITGRYRDGELSERTPGARRTMKILSGSRFQWIAYNVETKEFFGTGGGSYITLNGKYTERIDFFSRDNTRVGTSLQFDYKIVNEKWRHSGLSSKGEPLDEVWTKREKLGI